jgi:hypothetical protein
MVALTISPVPRMVPMIPFFTDSAMFLRVSLIVVVLLRGAESAGWRSRVSPAVV